MFENPVTAFSSVFLDKNPPVDAQNDALIQWCKKLPERMPSQAILVFELKWVSLLPAAKPHWQT